jgi:hypothetical protein
MDRMGTVLFVFLKLRFIRGEGQMAIMAQYACATYVVLASRFHQP